MRESLHITTQETWYVFPEAWCTQGPTWLHPKKSTAERLHEVIGSSRIKRVSWRMACTSIFTRFKIFSPHESYVRAQLLSYARLFATPWTVTTRLFCPWDFPGKNTRVGWYFLFQGSNPHHLCLLPEYSDSLPVNDLGSPVSHISTSQISR